MKPCRQPSLHARACTRKPRSDPTPAPYSHARNVHFSSHKDWGPPRKLSPIRSGVDALYREYLCGPCLRWMGTLFKTTGLPAYSSPRLPCHGRVDAANPLSKRSITTRRGMRQTPILQARNARLQTPSGSYNNISAQLNLP